VSLVVAKRGPMQHDQPPTKWRSSAFCADWIILYGVNNEHRKTQDYRRAIQEDVAVECRWWRKSLHWVWNYNLSWHQQNQHTGWSCGWKDGLTTILIGGLGKQGVHVGVCEHTLDDPVIVTRATIGNDYLQWQCKHMTLECTHWMICWYPDLKLYHLVSANLVWLLCSR
jgi:hypothetical protein